MSNETFVVFQAPEQPAALLRWVDRTTPHAQVVLFEAEAYVPPPLREGYRRVTYEDYLGEQDFDSIDQAALRLAQTWYLSDHNDWSCDSEGVSLGRATEYETMIDFVALMKHIALVDAIQSQEEIVTFVCFDDQSSVGRALRVIECAGNTQIEWHLDPTQSDRHQKTTLLSLRRFKPLARAVFQTLLVQLINFRRRISRWQAPISRCRVLFYSSFRQYVEYLHELSQAGSADIYVYNPSVTTFRELARLAITLITEDTTQRRAAAQESVWPSRWATLRDDVAFTGRFVFQGYSLWPAVERSLALLFLERFAELESQTKTINRLLERYRPDMIIVPQDVKDIPRLLVMAAQMRGIPTVATEHGIIADYPHRVLPLADTIAVWGEANVRFYLARGFRRQRLAIVGQPMLEKAYQGRRADLETGRTPNRTACVILFAAQPYVPISARNSAREVLAMLEMVVDACRKKMHWELLIKLHPAMDGSEITTLDLSDVNIRIINSGSTYDLISLADVVLTWSSTVGLEALVLGKPLIVLQIPGKNDFVPYVSYKAASGASTAAQLTAAIESITTVQDTTTDTGEGVARFIHDHVDIIPERRSVDRFIDLVYQMGGC
jgi:hypothetical protein